MPHTDQFTSLLVVLALAFFVPLLINRFKALPVVVGEIIAGLIFAQLGFLDPSESSTLTLFSNIGLAFLMFLAGLEINIPSLFNNSRDRDKKQRLSLPALVMIIYLLTLILGGGGSYLLTEWGMTGNIFLLTFIFGATSLGVVLPVLKKRGMLHSKSGQAIFIGSTVADLFTVILLTIYILFTQHGLNIKILSFLLILILFLVVARIGTKFFKIPKVLKIFDELSHATVQIKVRGAFVILLIFVVLAESLGVELILGAFLAGMLVGLFKSPQDDNLVHKLEAFGFGLFIPIFFIVTGANLNIQELIENPQNLIFLPVLFVISILVKLIPALLLKSRIGWRSSIAAGFLLNTHLSIEVAIAVIGEQLGLLTPATSAVIIVFAVLTVILMPIIFNVIQPATAKEAGYLTRLIYGWENNLARNVAQQLKAHGDRVKIVVSGIDDEKSVLSEGYDPLPLAQIKTFADEIDTAIILSGDDTKNLEISRKVQEAHILHVIALVNEPGNLDEFKHSGIQVFSPALYRSSMITLMARNPSIFNLLSSTSDDRDLMELTLRNSILAGQRIRDLILPGDSLILSIKRYNEILIPHGSTRLELNDQVSILVNTRDTHKVMDLFQHPLGNWNQPIQADQIEPQVERFP
ncbi:MAG: cation:proton antiporter [Anaerolineaceae bacterium]|jgi:Kef-type K+ transport system membrane component KefB/Trk K+ transport system NAD-binding subunit|nr:cation:proton antiporter [Anaerolineaceae bacterium]